jgi:hypothetical protein
MGIDVRSLVVEVRLLRAVGARLRALRAAVPLAALVL